MSNDQLPDQESPEVLTVDRPDATDESSQRVTGWSLSTMLIWMMGPLACFAVANLWIDSVSRVRLPLNDLWSVGFVITGLFYFLMFLPLNWLFSASGARFVSRILILLIASFFVFAIVFAPRFFGCLWASICFVSVLYAFRRLWPHLNNVCVGSALASISMLLTVGVYSFSMHQWPTFELQRLQEMRAEYPMVDVSRRIARLQRPNRVSGDLPQETIEFQNQLNLYFDENLKLDLNTPMSQLKLVHDAQFERFVRSPGFGGMRMNPKIIRYNPKRMLAREGVSPSFAHAFAYRDFFDRSTLGLLTEDQKHYVGFKPHSMYNAPESVRLTQQFELEKLELIGMLLHETPIVYVTNILPNMETIAAGVIPTRELTRFESRSLERLTSGETLVIDANSEVLRMVGALRAIDQCTDCHQVDSGQLLGAFSYEYRLKSLSPSANSETPPKFRNAR
ncbi:MAG: hypothetical protein JNK57_13650 [Planctomycetaceae bacterium]|nr:hypothetical protein [Planctomycetaceae bacterium]